MKRVFDILVATCGLVVLAPLLLIIALVIRTYSPGPVLYRAVRVGRHGRLFKLYKFRTMVADADRVGPAITIAQDPRITPIGRLLRKTKFDELPQLLNVLRGEMSLVGPRPESPYYVAKYDGEQRAVLAVRPGITSPASINFREEESLLTGDDWETYYVNTVIPAKIALDMTYVRSAGLAADIRVILHTLRVLALRQPVVQGNVSGSLPKNR